MIQPVATYEIADVMGDFELSICSRSLRMNDALWNTLAIEMGQQIDQVEVLQQQRSILASRNIISPSISVA